ncbi:MAG: carboxylating nicotinate-nucleotide diphosphorylase [Betaproteobacteria bacterium]|nr:carboxylating nicotinate-nucleotide diphosphorylase [Betaproteobacteria bacterium]
MSPESLSQARERNIRDALQEDIGPCDWTAQLISPATQADAMLRIREAAVLCGQEWFSGCITQLDPKASIRWHFQEGASMPADAKVCEISANARALLTAERPALNFLQLLSATATQTRLFADAIAGVSPNPRGCVVLDTRKTVPGLRLAQKYAVRIGGGANQRLALWDGILIKENHILAAGGIAAALRAARELNAAVAIQIEVESLDELLQALNAGAESILIDNFSLQAMREAVAINQGRALLEASGGIGLESVRAVAATGVDRISVGSITKDVKAIDFSLRVTARHSKSPD